MKKLLILIPVLALVLMGAGCEKECICKCDKGFFVKQNVGGDRCVYFDTDDGFDFICELPN